MQENGPTVLKLTPTSQEACRVHAADSAGCVILTASRTPWCDALLIVSLRLTLPLLTVLPRRPWPPCPINPQILIAERCVLHTLSFQLTVEHPYSTVMSLLKKLFTLGRGANGGKGVNKARNRQLSQVRRALPDDVLVYPQTHDCLGKSFPF